MFELDHIFVMTALDAPAADLLVDLGLREGPGNVHPGQGTANRRFFFAQNFLELLWVHDEAEVRSGVIAPTLLWARWQSQTSGYSPFGLCVRAAQQSPQDGEEPTLPDTWAYKPPYLPPTLQIDVVNNESIPQEPMLFQTPFRKQASQSGAERVDTMAHASEVKNITKVILHAPVADQHSPAMRKLLATDWLHEESAKAFHLTLELSGGQQQREKNFAPDLPLTIQW